MPPAIGFCRESDAPVPSRIERAVRAKPAKNAVTAPQVLRPLLSVDVQVVRRSAVLKNACVWGEIVGDMSTGHAVSELEHIDQ
jgi:hypothetical protein